MVDKQLFVFGLIIMFAMFLGSAITYEIMGQQIKIEKDGNNVIIENKKASKKEKRMINTIAAHIKNMIHGVKENFEYKLKVVSSHFPITVEIHGNTAIIKNFLGEKTPRKIELPSGIKTDINGGLITITSPNKELAGQAAANLERATRIRMKDRRVFQDGIFMISKAGRDI